MAAETNLIDSNVLVNAKVRELDFVLRFQDDLRKLMECLGVTRKIPMQAGTKLTRYKAKGTLASGTVAEGEIIPLSKYDFEKVEYKEITLNKYRKAASAEAIMKKGYKQAVNDTTDAMLKDAQKIVRTSFVNAVKAGKGTATGTNLQTAIANVWGQLQVKYEDTTIESVYFVNPLDVATYLGEASISTQTAFGMRYIEDFLGMGTVITLSDIPKGEVYGTAKDNIVLYYVPVNGADLGEAFSFTADQLGLIGLHEQTDYTRMTCEDIMIFGIEMFPERADGIVKGTITPGVGG